MSHPDRNKPGDPIGVMLADLTEEEVRTMLRKAKTEDRTLYLIAKR
jgi:hypothetical protein